MVLFPFHACQQVEVDVVEISEGEAERTQVKNGSWEQHVIDVYHRGAKDNVYSQQYPQERVDKHDASPTTNYHLK